MKSFIYLLVAISICSYTAKINPAIAIFFGLFFWGWHLKIKDLINAHKADKIFENKLQFLNSRIINLGSKNYKKPIIKARPA